MEGTRHFDEPVHPSRPIFVVLTSDKDQRFSVVQVVSSEPVEPGDKIKMKQYTGDRYLVHRILEERESKGDWSEIGDCMHYTLECSVISTEPVATN